jgi:hypothetical protein
LLSELLEESICFCKIAGGPLVCDSEDLRCLGIITISRKNVSQTPDGFLCYSHLAQENNLPRSRHRALSCLREAKGQESGSTASKLII